MTIMNWNILSLFDGMSGGQIALNKINFPIGKYYASEIDKNAMFIAKKNFPNTIHIGSVTDVKASDLDPIDLLIGGSSCQNFSFAGKRNGMVTKDQLDITTLDQYLELKENNFEFDGESYLFWEYVRLLKETKPKYFFLENVKMSPKWVKVIDDALGVKCLKMDSNLVSGQDRLRYYWTNIENIPQPTNKQLVIADIIQPADEVADNFWYDVDFVHHGDDKKVIATLALNGHDILKRVYNQNNKCGTLTCCKGGNLQKKVYQDGKCRKLTPLEYERLQTVEDNFTKYGLISLNQPLYNREENICSNVKSMNVLNPKLVKKLTSVTSITSDLLDMGVQTLVENLLIKHKYVQSVDAQENNKQSKVCVSSIIKNGNDLNQWIKPLNVKFVMTMLVTGQMECVLSTMQNTNDMEILYKTKTENINHTGIQVTNILKMKMVDGLIEELLKKNLEENSKKMKLYTILTLINLIITKIILSCYQTQTMFLCIDSSNLLQENLLEMDLLNLKMENIKEMSNSSRYDVLGNGWTIDVISHIFSGILNPFPKPQKVFDWSMLNG